LRVSAEATEGPRGIRVRARGTVDGVTIEHTAEIQYLWESVGKITGAVQDQQLKATVTTLPSMLLDPPESLALTSGKVVRMKVRVQRFDDRKDSLTLEAQPALEGVKFENNVLEPGANQIELRVTATGPISVNSFRLRAGTAVSPPIELKMGNDEEGSR